MALVLAFLSFNLGLMHGEREKVEEMSRHLSEDLREKSEELEGLREENSGLREELDRLRDLVGRADRMVDEIVSMNRALDRGYVEQVVWKAIRLTEKPEIVLGVAISESSLRPKIKADDGESLGLTGIQPKHWDRMLREKGIITGDEDYFDVGRSLMACEAILDHLAERFGGDMEKAILYYNGGSPGAEGKIKSTLLYGERVLKYAEILGG
jgi:hypothetical protein